MSYNPILVVAGEPNSIFFEIYFKSIKKKKFKSPIILICSHKLLESEIKHFNIKKKIRLLNLDKLNDYKLNNEYINVLNVNYKFDKLFSKISKKSNVYINECFSLAFSLLKNNYTNKLINGPISKKHFLKNQIPGVTEYIAREFNVKKFGMLIYNKSLSVCPLTTHYPISSVPKMITKNFIKNKLLLIDSFFKENFDFSPKIGVAGLNPHCESGKNFNEDSKIIKPVVEKLKKKINVSGPFPADTIFLKKNRKKFNVILGMYHDQVLTPIKTIYEYEAINVTMGLSFIRVSPDHGPNERMLGKNISNPESLIKSFEFLDRI